MPAKLGTGSAEMVNGVFQGANTADFSDAVILHTIDTAPVGTFNGNIGTYTTAAVSNTGTYRYVRYMGPTGKHSRVASVLFYTGDAGNVVVSNTGTTSWVTADAVKFVYQPAVDPIIMDKAPGDTPGIVALGGWASSSTSGGHEGDSYHEGNSSAEKSVRFTPPILVPGQYKVSVWWTQHSNRATNAPITVYHSGGSTPFTVNQEENGGKWNELAGTFTFAAGSNPATGSVLITNINADDYVIADAVRFERVGN